MPTKEQNRANSRKRQESLNNTAKALGYEGISQMLTTMLNAARKGPAALQGYLDDFLVVDPGKLEEVE